MENTQKYTKSVAISLVIANMIGTGVFTSLGFQIGPLGGSGFAILFLWLIGGIIALSGAFSYAEIGTMIKGSGGEYNYLGRIYHPALGFISGFVSLILGFAAAIGAVSMGVGEYFSPVVGDANPKIIAIGVIIFLSGIHLLGVKKGGNFQNFMTYFKLLLIFFFCVSPFFIDFESTNINFTPQEGDWQIIGSSAFAMSLAWIMFAYSGWNASTYIAGNMENPKRNLPFSLLVGTIVVSILYLFLNGTFLSVGPLTEMTASEANGFNVDVGNVAANTLFGNKLGLVFASLFSLALLSSVSAMIISGPRVLERIGQDYPALNKVAIKNKAGAPALAIFIQAAIAVIFVFLTSFQELIIFIAVTLTIFALLTVIGIYIMRIKEPNTERPYKTWGYPFSPLIFIIASLWMLFFFVKDKPLSILFALAFIFVGLILYFVLKPSKKNAEDILDQN